LFLAVWISAVGLSAAESATPQSEAAPAVHSPESDRPMDAARPDSGAPAPRSDENDAPGVPPRPVLQAAGSVEVVVYKSKRLLAVYRDGAFEKEFRIVLGLVPNGRKRHANDARTPEGRYRVTGKRRHGKWQHFLALDYPNAKDRERYESEVRRGTIPDEDGKPFGIGGDIGIHGNDREKEQAEGVDWTKGCIALSAGDVEAVNALVPAGAAVWIVE